MSQISIEQITIKQMLLDDVQKYKNEIRDFIYDSVKMSNYEESYTKEKAFEKAEELSDYVRDEKAIVLGAFYKESLIGFLWAYAFPFREDINRLYVSIVHVLDEYRNMHIGAELLTQIENLARMRGYDKIFLHAEATNKRACDFYESNNYAKERIQYVKKIDTVEGNMYIGY